jgi:hypothetical protein
MNDEKELIILENESLKFLISDILYVILNII